MKLELVYSGNLVPIRVETLGLGGAISINCLCMVVSARVLYSIAVTPIIWHHISMKSVCQ